MELLHAFGVDIRIFFAQLINFAVFMLILYRLTYTPILNLLETRKKKIEKGLQDAEKAKHALTEARIQEKEILENARKEASSIIQKSETSGRQKYQMFILSASKEIKEMKEKALLELEHEKQKALSEAKSSLADIVVTATEKLLRERIDAQKNAELIQNYLRD